MILITDKKTINVYYCDYKEYIYAFPRNETPVFIDYMKPSLTYELGDIEIVAIFPKVCLSFGFSIIFKENNIFYTQEFDIFRCFKLIPTGFYNGELKSRIKPVFDVFSKEKNLLPIENPDTFNIESIEYKNGYFIINGIYFLKEGQIGDLNHDCFGFNRNIEEDNKQELNGISLLHAIAHDLDNTLPLIKRKRDF